MNKKLYSIGEVAELNNISIQTLRYYDKIGLFTPASVDPQSHYRRAAREVGSFVCSIPY